MSSAVVLHFEQEEQKLHRRARKHKLYTAPVLIGAKARIQLWILLFTTGGPRTTNAAGKAPADRVSRAGKPSFQSRLSSAPLSAVRESRPRCRVAPVSFFATVFSCKRTSHVLVVRGPCDAMPLRVATSRPATCVHVEGRGIISQ